MSSPVGLTAPRRVRIGDVAARGYVLPDNYRKTTAAGSPPGATRDCWQNRRRQAPTKPQHLLELPMTVPAAGGRQGDRNDNARTLFALPPMSDALDRVTAAVNDKRLSDSAFRLYVAALTGFPVGAWIASSTLASAAAMTDHQARQRLRELTHAGVLERRRMVVRGADGEPSIRYRYRVLAVI